MISIRRRVADVVIRIVHDMDQMIAESDSKTHSTQDLPQFTSIEQGEKSSESSEI